MKIAIIGAGEMGGAFAAGLLKGTLLKDSLFKPEDITVSNPHENKLLRFQELGASVTTDNKVAIAGADFITIAVKPKVVKTVIDEIKPLIDYDSQTIVNMAASISIAQLSEWLDKDGKVPDIVQALPNIGIAEKASMTFLSPSKQAAAHLGKVQEIFNSVGSSLVVEEPLLNSGTALSGCGIAYIMRFVRAASEAGVELGFKADDAKNIVLQTMQGAINLLKATGSNPEAEIDKVTTPGGMTIKGLNAMEQAGFTNAVIQAFKGCLK
jgi:pyrroline-5-carboxylate reductase